MKILKKRINKKKSSLCEIDLIKRKIAIILYLVFDLISFDIFLVEFKKKY